MTITPPQIYPIFAEPEISAIDMAAFHEETRQIALRMEKMLEDQVKDCLSRWVSELEPAMLFNYANHFLGLGLADVPIGTYSSVIIPAPYVPEDWFIAPRASWPNRHVGAAHQPL